MQTVYPVVVGMRRRTEKRDQASLSTTHPMVGTGSRGCYSFFGTRRCVGRGAEVGPVSGRIQITTLERGSNVCFRGVVLGSNFTFVLSIRQYIYSLPRRLEVREVPPEKWRSAWVRLSNRRESPTGSRTVGVPTHGTRHTAHGTRHTAHGRHSA